MNRSITLRSVSVLAALTAAACNNPAQRDRENRQGAARSGNGIDEANRESAGKVTSAQVEPDTSKPAEARSGKMKSGKGFVQDIEALTTENQDFRRVLYTSRNCQLVVMALKPGEDIGAEVHGVDQFFRVEEGTGEVVLDGVRTSIGPGSAIIVPAGTRHNVLNTGATPMKLYTLYAPPNHRDGVVHHTRADADKDDEKYDGKMTQ